MRELTEKRPEDAHDRLLAGVLNGELQQIFAKLLDTKLDELVLYQYIYVLQNILTQDRREMGDTGWSPVEKAWVDAGLVKLMMTIAQGTKTSKWPALTSYFALLSMWDLTRLATTKQRRFLLQEMLDNNALQVCMTKLDHELAIHRAVAANILRCLATENFLGEVISSQQCCDIMVKLCQHILSGPEFYSRQFLNPDTTWQTFVCFGQFGHPREKGSKYAPRYFGMSQENAAFAIQGLIMTSPRLSQRFYLEIVQHNPELLDLMFKCASLPRFPWYPESQIDGLLCESLTLLMRVPHAFIPGLEVKLDYDVQKAAAEEWKLVLEGVKILLKRPKGLKLIMEVWECMEDEKFENILEMIQKAGRYHAQEHPDADSFFAIFEYRGSVRVSMERLIATLSYADAETDISTSDLYSLLRITNQAIREKYPKDLDNASIEEKCTAMETNFEIFRKPLYAPFTGDPVEPQMQVADEAVIGPTAHARVLTLLAKRGALAHAARRPQPLKGVSPRMTLPLLRQLTSEAALRKFAALARTRLTERKDAGQRRFTRKETDYACVAYITAAELAAALIAFDDATGHAHSSLLAGVRRDLVLCLGNAAQMSLNLKYYDRALCYAAAAVQHVMDLPTEGDPDAVATSIREKNENRLSRARELLKL